MYNTKYAHSNNWVSGCGDKVLPDVNALWLLVSLYNDGFGGSVVECFCVPVVVKVVTDTECDMLVLKVVDKVDAVGTVVGGLGVLEMAGVVVVEGGVVAGLNVVHTVEFEVAAFCSCLMEKLQSIAYFMDLKIKFISCFKLC